LFEHLKYGTLAFRIFDKAISIKAAPTEIANRHKANRPNFAPATQAKTQAKDNEISKRNKKPKSNRQKNKKKDLERERNITYTRLLPAIRL
jgi:hypothetical protein